MCNCQKTIITDNNNLIFNNRYPKLFNSHTDVVNWMQQNIISPNNSNGVIKDYLNSKTDGKLILPSNAYFENTNKNLPSAPGIYKGDTLLNYTEKIKNGSLTPDELGRFFNLYSKYTFEYPDLAGYSEDTQARVIASVFRKIGVIDFDLSHKEIYDFAKRYIPKQGSGYNGILKKYIDDGILSELQTNYVQEIIKIVNENSNENFSIANNSIIIHNLNNLIETVKRDRNLTQKESDVLVSTITMAKHIELPGARKTSKSIIINQGTSINCADCLWQHRHEITAWVIAAIVLLAAVTILVTIGILFLSEADIALLGLLGIVGLTASYIYIASIISQYVNWGVYKQYCGSFCADYNNGIIECNICPSYTYFFDGANCYLGWYHSNEMGWIYGDAFWYNGDTSFGCSDGNLTSRWNYAPFNAGGHGVYDAVGGACLFGYNYDTTYIPWVSSIGFYLKPHCLEIF